MNTAGKKIGHVVIGFLILAGLFLADQIVMTVLVFSGMLNGLTGILVSVAIGLGVGFGFVALYHYLTARETKLWTAFFRPLAHGGGKTLVKGYLATVVGTGLITGLFWLIPGGLPMTKQAVKTNLLPQAKLTVVFIIMAVIFAPLFEEIIFRGVPRYIFPRLNPVIFIVITAIIFSLAHAPTNLYSFAARLWMGLTFGWTFLQTNDIRTDMAVHSLWNLTAVAVALLL